MDLEKSFWTSLQKLVDRCPVIIDRPKNKPHPRYSDMVYPLDYGYLAGTLAGDGAGLDVWVGSLESRELNGVILTIDPQKREVEIKVLLGCTDSELATIQQFFLDNQMRPLLVRKSKSLRMDRKHESRANPEEIRRFIEG